MTSKEQFKESAHRARRAEFDRKRRLAMVTCLHGQAPDSILAVSLTPPMTEADKAFVRNEHERIFGRVERNIYESK